MEDAVSIFSRAGLYKKIVRARDIKSHEQARKLWPMASTGSPRELVTWVRSIFDDNGKLKRRSHFRTLPHRAGTTIAGIFDKEERERVQLFTESREHALAKKLVADCLRQKLESGLRMPWSFKDTGSSDFPFVGNLLLGAETVVMEERVKTAFGCEYRLDVAVLSPIIGKRPLVLGGVEIEWKHAFDGRKALIGKSQAFPLISLDISDMVLADITPEWAESALTQTTRDDALGLRKSYVYLHDLVFPLYCQIPLNIFQEDSQQLLVFAVDGELDQLKSWIRTYQTRLSIPTLELGIAFVTGKSPVARKRLENIGAVVGPDWESINPDRCLLLTFAPIKKDDVRWHLMYLCLANLLLSFTDTLVGYRYRSGYHNNDIEEDLWSSSTWIPEKEAFTDPVHVLPKRLAEPRSSIVRVLDSL